MASFVDDFLDLLEPDLATALSLSATNVYRGRSPRDPQIAGGSIEVWIEPQESAPELAGLGGCVVHRFRVHLRTRSPREGSKTGGSQHDTIRTGLQAVRRRYDGQRPFASQSAMADLIATSVGEEHVGEDAGREVLDRYLTLAAVERN